MNRKDFVRKTIEPLGEEQFIRLRDILDNERYIPFDFVDRKKIDKCILEEKVGDYFEKVELLAGGRRFDYLVEDYVSALDSVVRDNIDGNARSGKKEEGGTRAKMYYEKAFAMKKGCLKSFDVLLDYSRIMLCLYMAAINNKHRVIYNFDYSSECLDESRIIDSLGKEKTSAILVGDRKKFDTHSKYSMDRCTFIMLIIMYQYIKSKEIEG